MSSLVSAFARNHIIRAPEVIEIAQRYDLDIAAACILLIKESSGGHNVWGHDNVPTGGNYIKGAPVTKEAYLAYKRDRHIYGAQGVGPCQLTWPGFQDLADNRGGCWRWEVNVDVGFEIFADYVKSYGNLWEAAERYNGRASYADDFMERYEALNLSSKGPGMSGRYPEANWRPLAGGSQSNLRQHDIICLHTMVGSLWGTDAYFRQGGWSGTESHFGVGHDGEVLQWVNCNDRADANLDGNWHIISIETADYGVGFPDWDTRYGSQVPAWTPSQIESIAKIVAWACNEYDIPCELIPDSRVGRRGIGYHRQGVEPYMVSGGERWSGAYGKVCPGDRRIAQIDEILTRARQILGGHVATPPPPEPVLGDLYMNIPVNFYSVNENGVFTPDPAGLHFRASCPTEAGDLSAVFARAWVRWSAHWGDADFRIVFWDYNSPIWEADTSWDWYEVPEGARSFTIEGTRERSDVEIGAHLIGLPKK